VLNNGIQSGSFWRKRGEGHAFHAIAGMLVFLFLLMSCNPTKYVPENAFLLKKTRIFVDEKTINKNEMKLYMKQRPNARILGFWRFHLWLYNLSDKDKENGWLKRIGEAPVIFNPYLTEKTREEFLRYMQNRGFYNASVSDTVIFKKKKAEVYYSIKANQPTLIHSFKTTVFDDSIRAVLPQDSVKNLVPLKSRFDTDVLAARSKNVIRYLQNRGFYKLDRNEIYFEADTFTTKRNVDLNMIIDKENVSPDPNVENLKDHQRFTVRNFYYFTDQALQKQSAAGKDSLTAIPDTLQAGRHYFIYRDKLRFKPSLLINSNHIADQKFYSVGLVERTYNELYSLRLFKSINIRFVETNKTDSLGNPTLDCMIHLSPSLRQAYTVSFEGTNSLGKLGIAGNLGYQHKNLFRGGEIFEVNLIGGTEKQSNGQQVFHSFETGVDTKLTIPKFLAPLKSKEFFQYSTPQTLTDLSYNYQQRPDYTRTIFRASLGYQWKSSEYVTHRFNILDLNMVKMFSYDSAFISRIENLYIRSSYTDHSISSWNYSYTFNTQNIQKASEYKFLRLNVETAGNLLYGINKLFNRAKYVSDTLSGPKYHFLGTPFAQYIKTDLEYRKGFLINKYNTFALRGFAGVIVPYGNSDQVPFERKYFTGGANDIRAWPVRTLGPGSNKISSNEFPNQSGDVKLESNAEYRFDMIGNFKGAFFLDMGNIWSLRDNRPGSEFRIDRFYKQIALGTGLGIRYDFSYVILRMDLGIKLHDPSFIEPEVEKVKGWIPFNSLLTRDNYNIVFAIGYPF
jgi:outer membrane protein assembly factor BamA